MPDFLKIIMIVGAHATEEDAEATERCLYDDEPFMVAVVMNPEADPDDCGRTMIRMNTAILQKIREYRKKSQEGKSCLILSPELCGFPWIRIVMGVGAHPTLEDAESGHNWLYDEMPHMEAVTMLPTADDGNYVRAMTIMDSSLMKKIREYRGKTYAGGGMAA